MIYELKLPVKPEDLDHCGKLNMSALLYYAQEAAGAHATVLGTGWDELQKKNLFWAVIRTRAEVLKQPAGKEITLKTWPMPTSRTAYPRCVMGYDADGTLLFKVLSLWVLMDVNTRAMVLPAKSGVEVLGTIEGGEPEMPKGIPVTEQENRIYKTVERQQLDRNGHMNNTRYMDWVMELMPEKEVESMELCYFNEGRLDDNMELAYTLNDGTLSLNIHRLRTDGTDSKDRIFAASVRYSVNQNEK